VYILTRASEMSTRTTSRRRTTKRLRAEGPTGKVPRTYRLAPEKVANAQRILGTRTATETIEMALDMVCSAAIRASAFQRT
jgi:hypothetical protein